MSLTLPPTSSRQPPPRRPAPSRRPPLCPCVSAFPSLLHPFRPSRSHPPYDNLPYVAPPLHRTPLYRCTTPSTVRPTPSTTAKTPSTAAKICKRELGVSPTLTSPKLNELPSDKDVRNLKKDLISMAVFSSGSLTWLAWANPSAASEYWKMNPVYEVGELFELGIQLSYLLLLLGLLGVGTFFVIRQVLVRRELDLSAKELQEQVRSGDASATELFELGAVMLRRKFYPAATKYLLQAIDKWDGDDQDLAQVYNALGVSYVRDGKTDKGISQLETAVKIQPGYVTAWNNLGDAYEKKKEYKSALKAFEEALLFDPNNKVARPRRDALKEKVQLYKGVPLKSKQR